MAKTKKKGPDPKRKVIDALPRGLRPKVDSPRLKALTFSDLNVLYKVLTEYHDTNYSAFHRRACSTCCKWPP